MLRASLRPASEEEGAALQLAGQPGQVVSIVRIRMADGVPLAVEHACFSPELARLLELDLEGDSLHQALRDRGRHPTLGSSTITAEAAAQDASWLDVPIGEPVLVETRRIVDQLAAPLEYTVSRYVGSRYGLQVAFDVRPRPSIAATTAGAPSERETP